MPDRLEVVVCQRCGRGFVLTTTYRDFLARRGRRVIVPVLCPTCFLKKGPMPKQCGKVKWFDLRRHFGFIVTAEGEEVFFHQRQIVGNDRVETYEGRPARFHLGYSAKGPQALNVELSQEEA